MALRAGTLALNDPPETVKLQKHLFEYYILHAQCSKTHALPVHSPAELPPLTTSQYVPSGRDVTNVVLQTVSALFMATNPAEPNDTVSSRSRSMMVKLLTSAERDLLRLRRHPVGQRR
jgi:hypothetical protein